MPDEDDDQQQNLEGLANLDLDDMQILNKMREKKAAATNSFALMPVSFIGLDDGAKFDELMAKGDVQSNGNNGAGTGKTTNPNNLSGNNLSGAVQQNDAGTKSARKKRRGLHSMPKPPAKKEGESAYDGGQVNGDRAFWMY